LEGRNYMLLNAEITMLKKQLIHASQYVNCLTHGGQTVDKVPVDSLRAGKPALLNFYLLTKISFANFSLLVIMMI